MPTRPTEVVEAEVVDLDALPDIAATEAALPAVIEEAELAVELADALVATDEWADVDDGDLSPSDDFRIPLYQLNRKSDGGFLNEDTGETEHEISAVLMAKVNTRAWWPQTFGKGDAAPSCRSDNGAVANVERSPALAEGWVVPTKDLRRTPVELPTGDCSTCPLARWDGDDPAPCSEAIEFLAFVPTQLGAGRVVRLRFSGMGFAPARAYWQSFRTRLPKRVPISVVTHITLEPKETPNGTFLVPKFTRERELSFAHARPVLESRDAMTGEWRQQISTDDRPAVIDVDSTDDGPFADEEMF